MTPEIMQAVNSAVAPDFHIIPPAFTDAPIFFLARSRPGDRNDGDIVRVVGIPEVEAPDQIPAGLAGRRRC